jgi:ABC-2 type transport system permease protein
LDISYTAKVLRVSFISELKLTTRYVSIPGMLGFNIAVPFFFVLSSWIVATIISGPSGYSAYFTSLTGMTDYLAYLTIGFAFNTFIFSTAFGGAHAIRGEQEQGTAEVVFLTPGNKVAWLMGKMFGGQVFAIFGFAILLVSGFLLFGYKPQAFPNVIAASVAIALSIAAMAALGLVLAGLCFFAKREEEISQVLWPVFTFFCGLAFPVEILPAWGQIIAYLIPLTYGVDATRRALMLGMGLGDAVIVQEFLILLLQVFILLPLGLLIFSRLEREARRSGALGTY